MSNVAAVLKSEIARVARKQVRTEADALKKASRHYRSEIAALKKRLSVMEAMASRQLKRATREASEPSSETESGTNLRFSAKGLASKRKSLGLSASDCGILLNATAQTIYNWESGEARPREKHMPAIAAFRTLGKKKAMGILESLKAG